uniref:Inositol-1-monophosphatase n=1 Tax=Strigamia maritima TaxID=126957 RepID=T1IJ35_STRMM
MSNANVDLDLCFEIAVDLAIKSGERVYKVLCEKKTFKTKKNPIDLVTETDQEIEKFIFGELRKTFPTHRFIGEESTSLSGELNHLTDEPTWILDPVDGTMNFVHGLPYVAVSIALTEIGVIYAVGEQCLYTARKGKGAFRGTERLKVSKACDVSSSLVLTELMHMNCDGDENLVIKNVGNIFMNSRGVRVIGSAVMSALAVASGQAEAYFHYKLQCWDMAAIWLFITEAGGVIIDPNGSKFKLMENRMLCANSESLAHQISELLTDITFP